LPVVSFGDIARVWLAVRQASRVHPTGAYTRGVIPCSAVSVLLAYLRVARFYVVSTCSCGFVAPWVRRGTDTGLAQVAFGLYSPADTCLDELANHLRVVGNAGAVVGRVVSTVTAKAVGAHEVVLALGPNRLLGSALEVICAIQSYATLLVFATCFI